MPHQRNGSRTPFSIIPMKISELSPAALSCFLHSRKKQNPLSKWGTQISKYRDSTDNAKHCAITWDHQDKILQSLGKKNIMQFFRKEINKQKIILKITLWKNICVCSSSVLSQLSLCFCNKKLSCPYIILFRSPFKILLCAGINLYTLFNIKYKFTLETFSIIVVTWGDLVLIPFHKILFGP